MKIKIICRMCKDERAYKLKTFPVELKDKHGKVIGYICNKCYKKYQTAKFIQDHNIRQGKGETIKQAIRSTIKALSRKEKNQ